MKILTFIFALFLSFVPGVFGMIFSPSGSSDAWYNMLTKPILTPDGWVFAVAWTILYLLLAFALFFVIDSRRPNAEKKPAYVYFGCHMVLNALWSYFFFGLHWPIVSIIVLGLLIVVAILMAASFKSVSRPASYLVWPYIIWLLFALYLNAGIIYLN